MGKSVPTNLIDVLGVRVKHQPEDTIYTFLQNGEEIAAQWTYRQLHEYAKRIGALLQEHQASGERVLLLYPSGLEFIAAFWGCIYAGAIAVPAYPPQNKRHLSRIQTIVEDAQAGFLLTVEKTRYRIGKWLEDNSPLASIRMFVTDELPPEIGFEWNRPALLPEDVAFLQYTSGSTASPKGVMVSHGNLLHNLAHIQRCFEHTPESVGVSWLPPYHDMGLIGGILQPLFAGFPVVLMSPGAFLQRPARWLKAISDYRATTSGGPNFAYDLCAGKISPEQREGLDLSCWDLAFSGAEPVHPETLDRFSMAFADCGFRKRAFYPCYGLAESTLLVTGGRKPEPPIVRRFDSQNLTQHLAKEVSDRAADSSSLVSCGETVPGQQALIVDPGQQKCCTDGEIGEIWLSSPSVALGYWRQPEKTKAVFQASLGEREGERFLRTGDLGFLKNGELYVTGRLKDMIILRGRNYYPQDFEWTAERCHPAVRRHSSAAFATTIEGREALVLVAEVERRHKERRKPAVSREEPGVERRQTNDRRQERREHDRGFNPEIREKFSPEKIVAAIRQTLAEEHGVQLHAVVLLKYGSIPRTSSGKIQRHACKERFERGELEHVAEWTAADGGRAGAAAKAEAPRNDTEKMLVRIWEEVLGLDAVGIRENFFTLGGDSLSGNQVISRLEESFQIYVPFDLFFEKSSIAELAEFLDSTSNLGRQQDSLPPLQPVSRRQRLPLSRPQQRLWFFQQLGAEHNALHNIVTAWEFVGSLRPDLLEKSFNEIITRHEILRTNFMSVKGSPHLCIHPERPVNVLFEELRYSSENERAEKIAAAIQQEKHTPFNLESDELVRIRVLKSAEEKSVLILTVHHIVFDGWSMGILTRELSAFYNGFCRKESPALPPLEVQYPDFAFWQQEPCAERMFEMHQPYWEQQLAHAPQCLEFPADNPRTSLQESLARHERFEFSKEFSQKLRQMSQEHESTIFMTLLAAFSLLLGRYAAQEEFLIGSPVSGRKHRESENLIGMFAYPLVLRIDLSGNPTFSELMTRVRQVALEAYAHQDLPFGKLVETLKPERHEDRHPLIQVMFSFLDHPVQTLELSGMSLEAVHLENEAPEFDLFLFVTQTEDRLHGELQYNASLFHPETVGLLVEWFREILQRGLDAPESRCDEFSIPLGLQEKISTARQREAAQNIAVSANFTAEPLEASLLFWMQQFHIPSQVSFAPYNQVFQQLLDPSSVLSKNRHGFNIILLRLEEWLPSARTMPEEQYSQAEVSEKNFHDFVSALQSALERSTVPYLLCLCPSSPATLEDKERVSVLEQIERRLSDELKNIPGVALLLTSDIVQLYPLKDYYDLYSDRVGHVPFNPAFFASLGTTLARRILAMKRKPYKVIVLDCDNTLWKGVCGEDGAFGVKLPSPYLALQKCMLEQREAGMLLCLGSKNSEEDVFEVFERRSEMLLKREHLVANRINWRPKSENLIELAEELNVGLDSFIFIDDNPLECAEVRTACPEVLTLQLPDEPERIPHFLQHVWAFDRPNITEEDRLRSIRYQQGIQRERFRRESLTFHDFLEQLELKLSIHSVEAAQLPRVSQLTQRTNQFNLTTIRRTEQDIQRFCDVERGECLVTELSDRFGEYGLVGVVLFKTESEAFTVDSFLLSCRALGRGVEHEMLAELGRLALQRGLERVELNFIHSSKNRPALDFLESVGQTFKEKRGQGALFRFPAQAAADITFQPEERGLAARGKSESGKQEAKDGKRRAAEEPRELLQRIASELYDIDRVVNAISAEKQRRRSDELDTGFIAPRNDLERGLEDIWTELLNVDRVGVYDNFFQLGGHSLLATQILSRVVERFQVELPLQSLLNEPNIAGIAAQIAMRLDKNGVVPEQQHQVPSKEGLIRAVPRDLPLPLSFSQERLWFFQQLEPDSAVYNVAANARLTGELNLEALRIGMQEIVRRHESLRTRFVALENGTPVQIIEAEVMVELPLEDLSALSADEREIEVQRLMAKEIQTPFELTRSPLFRFSLVRIQKNEHLLLATLHHIISDEWSVVVFLRELSLLYDAFSANMTSPLPRLDIQYADFAYWQRQRGQSELFEKQLNYWKMRLDGLPPMLDLPTDRPRPSIQSYRGASTTFVIPPELSEGLKNLSRQEQATLFMTFLTAFNVLLYRYSGSKDIAVGFPVANRNLMQLEPLIGFFVNTLVLRTDLSGDPDFRALLRQTRQWSAEAQDNQDLPFERLVAELHPKRELSHNPLFQVMFVWYTTLPDAAELVDGLCLTPFEAEGNTAMFDLTLIMEEKPDGVRGQLIYNRDLFDGATIERMAGHFRVLLEGIAAKPEQKISLLPLLRKHEEKLLLREWNRTEATYPDQHCIHQLFEAQVETTPEATALVHCGKEISYRELNQRANQVAHYLRQCGVGPDVIVGIYTERSIETLVGLLGIVKAGGAYLPLDPQYPKQRIEFMLSDAQISLMLTQHHLRANLSSFKGKLLCLDSESEAFRQESCENLCNLTSPENLVYVIYTSGSTGRPKGTLLAHRGLCNLVVAQRRIFHVSPESRLLQFVSLGFDVASSDIFTCLCSGATLHLVEQSSMLSTTGLVKILREQNITHLEIPSAVLQSLPSEDLPDLHTLIVGGESCPIDVVKKWAVGRRFLNAYGPTETTVCATVAEFSNQSSFLPLGRPLANIQTYILDPFLQPVPIGVAGELHVGGVGLARGYLNNAKLTSEKFIPNPFRPGSGERLYKTGDLARYWPDGNIEFLGRVDHQVKLRGFRIELGEIEQSLSGHPDVCECAVLLREDQPGDKRLAAYLVLMEDSRTGAEELRNFLTQSLPEYMVPSYIIILEKLPLTPNGKVDRRALPAPDSSLRYLQKEFVAPRTETEKRLAGLWRGILNVEQVGIYDDFFELGGHSLLAAQLSANMSNEFKREVPVQQLFLHPTIAQLAEVLEERAESFPDEKVSLKSGPLPGGSIENLNVFHSPFLQFERRPLLPLILTKKIPSVDAAALSYLDPLVQYLPTFNREDIIHGWCQGLPVLSHVFETEWGRIAHLFLPRFAADLYTDREDAVDVARDALRIAGAIGAKVVSLTGIIPSATDYGRAIVKALEGEAVLPQVTTGHATTCATVVLTIKQILETGGRKMQQERVGFLGLGSVGLSVLRLMLQSLPHPEQLFLCDVYGKREELERVRQEVQGELGFEGHVSVIATQKDVPEKFYDASLIVGATNVADVLDVDRLGPGTMIVDDSGPHCFRSDKAIARFEKQQDILFSEGGMLHIPHPLKELQYIPPYLERAFSLEQLERRWQKEHTQITGCVLSSLLSARFEELPSTIGMVKTSDALLHYEKLLELGCRAADLRCEDYSLPEEFIEQFRQRFHS